MPIFGKRLNRRLNYIKINTMAYDWKRSLSDDYRKKFGCKNIGKVCWCQVCCDIEKLIADVIKKVKDSIPD